MGAATRATDSRAGLMRWAAVGVLALLGFTAFLSFAAGARLDAATVGLVFAAGMLVFSLGTLFRMVQALARPGQTLAPKARELAGANKAQLREEKRRLLRAINELKFDFEMGKLSEADFTDVKQTYELRAVEVMRQLDGAKRVHPEVVALLEDRGLTEVVPQDIEEDERAPAAEPSHKPEAPTAEAEPDASEPAQDAEGPEETSGTVTCEACEGENDKDAKFCKHCGQEISA